MSKKNIFGFEKHTWFGKLTDMYPFNILAAYLAKSSGAEMTNSDKEKADYEDALADENADVAYMRQKEFQENYLTPEAQLKSQAVGYDSVGLNRMLLGGSQPGASASTSPMSSGGSAGSAAGSGDFVSSMMSILTGASQIREVEASAALQRSEKERVDIENKWADKRQEVQYKNELLASRLAEVNIRKLTAEAENAEWLALYAPDIFQSQIDERDANASKAFSDIDKNVSDIELNDARVNEINSIISKNKHEIEQIDALSEKIRQEYWNLVAEEDLTRDQIKECKARTAKWNEEVKEIASRIGLNEADLQWYVWNHPRTSSFAGLKWNKSSYTGSKSTESIEGWSTPQLLEELKKRGALPN